MAPPATDIDRLDADRAMLVDFIHHGLPDCDAAAQRLQHSPREGDRLIGREWLKIRARERDQAAAAAAADETADRTSVA